MGIDIYMSWDNMTEDEKERRITGFSVVSGHVGYLREAYHGGPYATRLLVPEAFAEDAPDDGVEIPAALLRERLTTKCEPAGEHSGHDLAAGVWDMLKRAFPNDCFTPQPKSDDKHSMTVVEAVWTREKRLYNSPDEHALRVVESYIGFVELAEEMEAKTGKPVRVFACW